MSYLSHSAQDPFNLDADPDPGSALVKMDPGHFFEDLLRFINKTKFSNFWFYFFA